MFTLQNQRYDHPTFLTLHEEHRAIALTNTNTVQRGATFRSALRCLVTNIYVILQSVASKSQILTLLFNGSVAAVLTLGNTINQNIASFTLAINYEFATMVDRFEISPAANDAGKIYVIYQYRIVQQDIVQFGTNTI